MHEATIGAGFLKVKFEVSERKPLEDVTEEVRASELSLVLADINFRLERIKEEETKLVNEKSRVEALLPKSNRKRKDPPLEHTGRKDDDEISKPLLDAGAVVAKAVCPGSSSPGMSAA